MALVAGTRLGPYEIVGPIGAGGMGEVYRARDTRLDRIVALKVLAPKIAGDPAARARFEREARAVAALDHPNICGIFDIGEAHGTHFLVMPLLEGQTLGARLERGPLPLDQALAIASQIADALDKAHRQGIVHRDLKPANIMLAKGSAGASSSPLAKLLDFGLAKLRGPGGPISLSGMTELDPRSPGTAQGTILGTLPYMAPEQVEGKEADPRSDIWALGAVLYEMVTGERPFSGDSPASVIGAILKDHPPPLSVKQPLAPAAVDHIVERCLDKDPDERWQNAGDVRRELGWAARAAVSNAEPPASRSRTRSRVVIAAATIGLLLGILAGLLSSTTWFAADVPSGSGSALLKFEVLPPPDATLSPAPTASTAQVAISPDGMQLAFVAARTGESHIWIRPLDRVAARVVAGTEGAEFPFWSPDGRFLAFFSGGKLKKVDLAQGTSQTLADVPAGRGGSWSPSGTIVFGQSTSPLSQVPAIGGPVTPATSFDPAQDPVWHYWPHFLPDGHRFLFLQRSLNPDHQGIYVGSLDSKVTTRLASANVRGLFASGHLLFMRDGVFFAQAVDERTLQATGEPAQLTEGVGFYAAAFGYAAIDATATGIVAFGPSIRQVKQLQTFDRKGTVMTRHLEGAFASPRLARDERTVAVSVREALENADIWTIDLVRNQRSRVSSHREYDWFPAWMPDGRHLLFGSTRAPSNAGAVAVYRTDVSGTDMEEALHGESVRGFPTDVSRDGEFVLFHNLSRRGYDIGAAALAVTPAPVDFLSTPFNELQARFSPDRRWVAYASDESGRFEVYVRAWPSAAGRTTISQGGGMQPEWRRDGKELFYLSADRRITAVPITYDGDAIAGGAPQALFSVDTAEPVSPYPNDYAVTADGQRFIVAVNGRLPAPQTLTVIYNWTETLKR